MWVSQGNDAANSILKLFGDGSVGGCWDWRSNRLAAEAITEVYREAVPLTCRSIKIKASHLRILQASSPLLQQL
jgi:hypothetical protein